MSCCDILATAETRRTTETGESVARPRWQVGWLFTRGKKNPVWIGRFREDAIAEDGTRTRRQQSVILGLVHEMGDDRLSENSTSDLRPLTRGDKSQS